MRPRARTPHEAEEEVKSVQTRHDEACTGGAVPEAQGAGGAHENSAGGTGGAVPEAHESREQCRRHRRSSAGGT